jgi:hypothetical protein
MIEKRDSKIIETNHSQESHPSLPYKLRMKFFFSSNYAVWTTWLTVQYTHQEWRGNDEEEEKEKEGKKQISLPTPPSSHIITTPPIIEQRTSKS